MTKLPLHYKLYIPLQILDESSRLVELSSEYITSIYSEIDSYVESFGGLSLYNVMGKYYNKSLQKVFNIRTLVMDICIEDKVEKQFETKLTEFTCKIKHQLKQESVAFEKNGEMHLV